ncbi:CGNR zinc finger domain-containing protein [Streptomyces sp. NPDC003035]|uniref:CGNR zinc finger domain-containing protein n=1 Tax=Streptomyces sp. NPDC003035 TaxID=3364676 RepID=UPI0036A9C531
MSRGHTIGTPSAPEERGGARLRRSGSPRRPGATGRRARPWHLHVDRGEDTGWADWFLASSALVLAQLLADHGRITWGVCAAARCSTLYLGAGPGSAQGYCSAACASRERVAAQRRRARR